MFHVVDIWGVLLPACGLVLLVAVEVYDRRLKRAKLREELEEMRKDLHQLRMELGKEMELYDAADNG